MGWLITQFNFFDNFSLINFATVPLVDPTSVIKVLLFKFLFSLIIIFWKGHVAVCINSNNLIHAYGPKKKVVIMPIQKTIKRIEKTTKLKVKKVFRI